MHNSKLKRITLALCIALLPVSVLAAGLGKLNVMSGLGEPLKADIELISITPEELSSITAAIASEEAYAIQGVEKPASHNTIKVEVSKNASGAPILKLKSAQPISEPFLDMLIQVDWASGRLLREYTVLLDPPGYTGESDPDAQATQATQVPVVRSDDGMPSEAASIESNASSDALEGSTSTVITTSETVMPSADTSGQEHLTQSGDTLGKIALEMKPEGVSLEQMLVGLYQANPDAFQGSNMNRLKVGQIIRSPAAEELNAITRKEASGEIKVQTANWNAYRNQLAGIVVDAAPSDTEANSQSAGGKIKSAAEDQSIPTSTGTKDVVKLSAGDAAATTASAGNIKTLQEKIATLQEEATAREKSVQEAQDRTASLEKQIADMQKLLAMKNAAMSDLQKQAEMQAAPAKPQAEAPKDKPTASTSAAESVKNPVKKLAPEPSFLSGMLDGLDLGMLAPAGGVLALLGGGWMYLRKKREKSLADFERGIMRAGGLKVNTVFGSRASAGVDAGDTSFLTDFSQSTNGSMIDANDVDPIAEAEVYMAYGRDAQAEEILKDAISKESKRYELHLKLLEMYAASKNMSAFETISGELYTILGSDDPTWARVAEIGIKLEPNNPLYQVSSSLVGSGVAISGKASAGLGGKLDVTDFSDSALVVEKDLDFSFDNEALTQDFASTGAANGGTEDLGLIKDVAPLETAMEAPVADAEAFDHAMPSLDIPTFLVPNFMPEAEGDVAETPAAGVLDMSGMTAETSSGNDSSFDVTTIQTEISSSKDEGFAEPKIFDLTAIDLDLKDGQSGVEAAEIAVVMSPAAGEPIEVETKLDLVAAYIEMDDKAGAKELLAEVMKEGGANQRKRAEAFLAKLA